MWPSGKLPPGKPMPKVTQKTDSKKKGGSRRRQQQDPSIQHAQSADEEQQQVAASGHDVDDDETQADWEVAPVRHEPQLSPEMFATEADDDDDDFESRQILHS